MRFPLFAKPTYRRAAAVAVLSALPALGGIATAGHLDAACTNVFIDGGRTHVHDGGNERNHCWGSHANDTKEDFWVNGGGDYIEGNEWFDEIHLAAGNDRSYGGSSVDHTFGGAGDDRMFGNRGDDIFQDNQSGGDANPDHDYVCGGHETDNRTDIRDTDESDIFWGEGGANDLPITKDPGDIVYEDDPFNDCSTL